MLLEKKSTTVTMPGSARTAGCTRAVLAPVNPFQSAVRPLDRLMHRAPVPAAGSSQPLPLSMLACPARMQRLDSDDAIWNESGVFPPVRTVYGIRIWLTPGTQTGAAFLMRKSAAVPNTVQEAWPARRLLPSESKRRSMVLGMVTTASAALRPASAGAVDTAFGSRSRWREACTLGAMTRCPELTVAATERSREPPRTFIPV